MTRALIVVDVQKDFVEGGSLAVVGGQGVAYRIADGIRHLRMNSGLYDYYVATKDFHNAWPDTNDGHFNLVPDYVDTWPIHCVSGTGGADFADGLYDELFDEIFYKGRGKPAYSGFQGMAEWRNGVQHGLHSWLNLHKVDTVDICGIATDYCVKATAEDARALDYRTRIVPGWTVAVGGPNKAKEVIDAINNG